MTMTRSLKTNLERSLKWEKQKVDKKVNHLILLQAEKITETLLDIGINERNPTVLNSLLDRAFGKARQNIGLDGGADDKPIVFMPASLMGKYGIQAAEYTELEDDPSSPEYQENGPAGMLVEPLSGHEESLKEGWKIEPLSGHEEMISEVWKDT